MKDLKTVEQVRKEKEEELNNELQALEMKRGAYEVTDRTKDLFTFPKVGKSKARIMFRFIDEYSRYMSDYIEPEKEEMVEIIEKILKAYPPRKAGNHLGFAGKEDQENKSPFKLGIKNPCSGRGKAELEYYTEEGINIEIEFDHLVMYKDLMFKGRRGITDSEHHYFTGVSMRKLREMSFDRYYLLGFPHVNYYGGSCVTYLDNESLTEEYNNLILKGEGYEN